MAISKFSKPIKYTVEKSIDYISNIEKIKDEMFLTGINCLSKTADVEFEITRQLFNKDEGIKAHHLIQSFKGRELTPEKCHELGLELAEKMFPGFQVVVATHQDTDNLHNHILINSVNMNNGRKLNRDNALYQEVKSFNDKQAIDNRLSLIVKHTGEKALNYKDWLDKREGISKRDILKQTIQKVKEASSSWGEFKELMELEGYTVNDKTVTGEERKYVTYLAEGDKGIRCRSLGYKFTKENIENEMNGIMYSDRFINKTVYTGSNREEFRRLLYRYGILKKPIKPLIDMRLIKKGVVLKALYRMIDKMNLADKKQMTKDKEKRVIKAIDNMFIFNLNGVDTLDDLKEFQISKNQELLIKNNILKKEYRKLEVLNTRKLDVTEEDKTKYIEKTIKYIKVVEEEVQKISEEATSARSVQIEIEKVVTKHYQPKSISKGR